MMKSSLTDKRTQPWKVKPFRKPGLRVEFPQHLDVAVHEHVLPRDERVVEDEDGVVLVETAGQGIVER